MCVSADQVSLVHYVRQVSIVHVDRRIGMVIKDQDAQKADLYTHVNFPPHLKSLETYSEMVRCFP